MDLTNADKQKAAAFISQAREYYRAISSLGPVAKPLVAYYFALNLSKAFLTLSDPKLLKALSYHGLSQSYTAGTNYSFKREAFKTQQQGVFQELAKRTGMQFCWPAGSKHSLSELMPYLVDGYDAYADASAKTPKLLPVDSIQVIFGDGAHKNKAWLRVEVDRGVLLQRQIKLQSLLAESRVMGDRFELVQSDLPTASYESNQYYSFGKKKTECLPDLRSLYDQTVFGCDRSFIGSRRFLVLSKKKELVSHEALTFAVVHHLSNLVRYRPRDAERLVDSPNGWLLSSWVDRASESFLLNMASRITGDDHVFG